MQSRRFDQILTGSAIALVLGLTFAAQPAAAQGESNAAIEAKVPLPEPANLPPPTAADVTVSDDTTGTVVNLPDPPDLPPPAFKDVAIPAPATTTPAPAAAAPSAPAPAAAAPEPVKAAAPADQPIRDALYELIGSRLARIVDRKPDRTAVEAFYSSRDYAPLFAATDGATTLAKQAID